MTALLAARQPAPTANNASSKKMPQESAVPAATAPPQHALFELLRRPQLALGQGLIFKRKPSAYALKVAAGMVLHCW